MKGICILVTEFVTALKREENPWGYSWEFPNTNRALLSLSQAEK